MARAPSLVMALLVLAGKDRLLREIREIREREGEERDRATSDAAFQIKFRRLPFTCFCPSLDVRRYDAADALEWKTSSSME
jgi:hypothetical protein